MNLLKWIVIGGLLAISSPAFSAAPTCQHSGSGEAYCQYTGKVDRIYINSGNTILIYFDTAMDLEQTESVGFTVTSRNAAAYPAGENQDFARMFYSTALAAQASGRNITIQMRGNLGSYLKFDRIWLAE